MIDVFLWAAFVLWCVYLAWKDGESGVVILGMIVCIPIGLVVGSALQ